MKNDLRLKSRLAIFGAAVLCATVAACVALVRVWNAAAGVPDEGERAPDIVCVADVDLRRDADDVPLDHVRSLEFVTGAAKDFDTLNQRMTGNVPTIRDNGPGDFETKEIAKSAAVEMYVSPEIDRRHYRDGAWSVNLWSGLATSPLDGFYVTAWKVGGFGVHTLRRRRALTILIDNDRVLNSFLVQAYAEWLTFGRADWAFGPFGNTHLHFTWSEPLPEENWEN
jgi:hypothetical protein